MGLVWLGAHAKARRGRRRTARWSLSQLREVEEYPDKEGPPVSETGRGPGLSERGKGRAGVAERSWAAAFSLGRESVKEGESIGSVRERATGRGKSRPRGRIGARMKLDCGRPNRRERRETGPVPREKVKKR